VALCAHALRFRPLPAATSFRAIGLVLGSLLDNFFFFFGFVFIRESRVRVIHRCTEAYRASDALCVFRPRPPGVHRLHPCIPTERKRGEEKGKKGRKKEKKT